jgi:hypothetical protein
MLEIGSLVAEKSTCALRLSARFPLLEKNVLGLIDLH